METIRVNMTPCEDIKTIHASQNDNEAREWGFELHNNGEKIDSSSISDQLVFKAYKGGTEEILPTNGSTPTTSPFKGDIKYPQGLLSDQEFLYRESPTEEDGLAKITDIKGNTLVWNQLVQNGNFADGTNHWSGSMGTSVANNICTLTANSTSVALNFNQTLSLKSNHKYLIKFDIMPSLNTSIMYNLYDGTDFNITKEFNATANTWYNYAEIVQPTNDIIQFYLRPNRTGTQGSTYQLKNVNIIDLTQMGLDISSPSDFTSLFSLPYYDFNQGSLLSFMGNGIKTVGKNLWDNSELIRGVFNDVDFNHSSSQVNTSIKWYGFADTTYTVSWGIPVKLTRRIIDGAYSVVSNENVQTFTLTPTKDGYIGLSFRDNTSSTTVWNTDTTIQIEVGSTTTAYEFFTSSTLSLPISTYFPTGMKSAGSVYDELTPTKAITRIGAVDLGTLNWRRLAINEGYAFVSDEIADMKQVGNVTTANALCPPYTLYMSGNGYSMAYDKTYRVGGTYFGTRRVAIRDDSYTDATAFKIAMNGVYLYYELATESESTFTTASLVTENGEVALANENGVLVGKCNSDVSADAGFIEGKIKLSDEDGDAYSNKIQIHVERSPQ